MTRGIQQAGRLSIAESIEFQRGIHRNLEMAASSWDNRPDGGGIVRMKTRIVKQQAAEQAKFVMDHPELFREPKPIQPVAVEPEFRPTAPSPWGCSDGRSDVGNG